MLEAFFVMPGEAHQPSRANPPEFNESVGEFWSRDDTRSAHERTGHR